MAFPCCFLDFPLKPSNRCRTQFEALTRPTRLSAGGSGTGRTPREPEPLKRSKSHADWLKSATRCHNQPIPRLCQAKHSPALRDQGLWLGASAVVTVPAPCRVSASASGRREGGLVRLQGPPYSCSSCWGMEGLASGFC